MLHTYIISQPTYPRTLRFAILYRVNTQLQQKLKTLPSSPGVYFHKSASGEVIYVGKAAVLKNRVRQYFQDSRGRDNKTMALVSEIYDTDWIEVESEVDALFLESEMVKRYMPRYNVLLRDDKSQSYVRIDMKSEWPTVTFTRNPIDDGAEYYGPFYNGFALKKAVRYLRRVFPYLTRERRPGQSRLDEDLGLSPKKSDSSEAYKANLRKLISYIKGNRKALAAELERDMKTAAKLHDFEKAAELRNKLHAMKELQRRVMFGDREFLNISKDQALADLTELLGLTKIPARIEGYDISHMSGKNVVASMVVFTNGASDRAEYRKFKTSEKNDDTGNIYETLLRRFSERNSKSWGKPDLLLIDGGKGQLRAAIKARDERGMSVPIIGIAKREEEIIIHKTGSQVGLDFIRKVQQEPIAGVGVLEETEFITINLHVGRQNASSHSRNLRGGDTPSQYDDVIKLFQRIRDEAHRFAISYHTTLKRQGGTQNILESIPGIGPKTRAKLLRKFGSVKGVERASEDELESIVGQKTTKLIRAHIPAKKPEN